MYILTRGSRSVFSFFLVSIRKANVNIVTPGETINNHYSSLSAMRVQINSFSFHQIANGNSGEEKEK